MSIFYNLLLVAVVSAGYGSGSSEFCDAGSTACYQTEPNVDLWRKLLVAAIDFGTTFSGWAFLFKHEYNKDPSMVTCKTWRGEGYSSLKAPTTVLIEPDGKTFLAFGYDAETKYAKLAAAKKHQNYYYFKRFKMLLHGNQDITRTTTIEDDQGHVLPAITVFALVIQYLKQDLKGYWLDQGIKVDDSEVRWVLTVPAIWNDKAKQFMREAAIQKCAICSTETNAQGGIEGKDLLIALEPEAASLYSRLLPVQKMEDDQSSFIAALEKGSKYMIIDAGGGTVDITVHEIIDNRYLKELHKADGGPWGGTKVDNSFSEMLESVFGKDVLVQFRINCGYDYLELSRDFESKKKEVSPDTDDEMIIRYSQCLSKVLNEVTGETLNDKISSSPYKEHLLLSSDHLLISADISREFFQDALDSIVDKVKSLLEDPKLSGLDSILLVGGFADSQMLRRAIKTSFSGINVFIPKDAGAVVLKGAVIFGFNQALIALRVCKYTYGIEYVRTRSRRENECDEDKKEGDDCVELFKKFVEIGDEIRYNEIQGNESFIPRYEDSDVMAIRVYACDQHSPVYITEPGCRKLGHVNVKIHDNNVPRKKRIVWVAFTFSGTEIKVTAIEERTGKETSAVVNFLG